MSVKILICSLAFIFFGFIGTQAQTSLCPTPPGYVCITQAAGNVAAQNAKELEAQKEKVKILEDGLAAERKSIEELKVLNAKNIADLTLRINELSIQLADATGRLAEKDNTIIRQTATIEVLARNSRKKCLPFSVCF